MIRRMIIISAIFLFSGCTTYIYYGQLQAPDGSGKERTHLLYWSKTERLLWFDEVSGSIRLLSSCSHRTVNFAETDSGVIFRCTPQDEGVDTTVNMNSPCGRIVGYQKIADIPEGEVRLKIICRAVRDGFSLGNQDYLAADSLYSFHVIKKERAQFEQGAPTRPPCSE